MLSMPTILQLTRKLTERPEPTKPDEIVLRHYSGPRDIETWLEVRRRAFARQKVGIGNWTAADFEREFLSKPWWRPEAMWLAESRRLMLPSVVVGTVTLARRGDCPDAKPVVHWLAVVPSFRRRGLGRFLVSTLEAAVWDAGGRQVWLETHSLWTEAQRLYESMGYEPVDPSSPSGP
ncbi:MAG: GNAT family N-acetyltransferase [Planctomycetota bacterium]|nr:MAG: GNAT family N-acetyltransferase [Planctomycetota bacterium]